MSDRVSTIFTPANQKYYATPVSSTPTSKKKNIIAFIVTALGVVLTSYFGYLIVSRFVFPSEKPYFDADVFYGKAKVFIDDTQIGETPVSNFLVSSGLRKIKLVGDDGSAYETSMQFASGYPGLVKRDLGIDVVFSSGFDVWHERSSSGVTLSVISEPSDALVYVDGSEMGRTPFSSDKLVEGAYEIRVEREGYESQSLRLAVSDNQKINIAFKLFPLPSPATVSFFSGSTNMYDVYISESIVTSNPKQWAKALAYWNKTRGINIMGYGVNRDFVFKYILDSSGTFYDTTGEVVEAGKVSLDGGMIAYLRNSADGDSISTQAKESLEKIGTDVALTQSMKVTPTPTGWLRMRSTPSLSGTEVGRVNTGEIVSVIEKGTGWVKIKSTSGIEGWASTEYLQSI